MLTALIAKLLLFVMSVAVVAGLAAGQLIKAAFKPEGQAKPLLITDSPISLGDDHADAY